MNPARRAAIHVAQSELKSRPVYLDTETTGLDPWDEIVDICVLDTDGDVLLDSLVRPNRRIPAGATAVHGLTDALVADAPAWAELWPKIEALLADRRVAIYNAAYDLRLMRQSHSAHHLPWTFNAESVFCVMRLYAQFFGAWEVRKRSYRWHRLEDAGRHLNIALPNAHRAKADALLAREVLLRMAEAQ